MPEIVHGAEGKAARIQGVGTKEFRPKLVLVVHTGPNVVVDPILNSPARPVDGSRVMRIQGELWNCKSGVAA